MISSLLYNLNHAALWRYQINVWDRSMRAASLDRLVALGLHRLGWMGRDEAILLRKLVRPGMHVVDVGANIGLYSLLLARLVGQRAQSWPLSPNPIFSQSSTRIVSAIMRPTSRLSSARLGRVNGLESFHRSAFNSGDNRLGHASMGHDAVEVKVERFDDLQPDSEPDFVKIDVQGHELAALCGMERALSANPNVRVFFEFSPAALRRAETPPDLLLEFFRERGFELYETEGARLKKLRNSRQLISDLRGRRYTNLLAARDTLEIDD